MVINKSSILCRLHYHDKVRRFHTTNNVTHNTASRSPLMTEVVRGLKVGAHWPTRRRWPPIPVGDRRRLVGQCAREHTLQQNWPTCSEIAFFRRVAASLSATSGNWCILTWGLGMTGARESWVYYRQMSHLARGWIAPIQRYESNEFAFLSNVSLQQRL